MQLSRPLTRFHFIVCLIATATFAAEQPVPFSHKQHIALTLKCKDCHANPDPGESMALPAASECMACHVSIATDKPAIRKLKSFAKEPIPWVPVFQIPSTIVFSHRVHRLAKPHVDDLRPGHARIRVSGRPDAPERAVKYVDPDSARYTEAMQDLTSRITINRDQCGGRPCIRGIRVRVSDVLDLFAAGLTAPEILQELPYLDPEDLQACLQYAAREVDHPVLLSR